MEEKKLVPKRRMSKYSEEWVEKEFNNLGNFGKIYPFSRSVEGVGRFHHIHYGDIHTKSFGIIENNSKLPTIKVEGSFELAKPGDIVIADASEDYKDLGKSVVIGANTNRQIIAGLHTFKFTPNEQLCPLYYLYYSQTRIFKKFSYKTGTGISVFGMSKDNLGKMKLYIPTIEEQQKIGEFFKTLDERIANQERKIAKGKALKAAYLNEMFPQEGEAVPKRRFKGFEGEWEEKSLDEISNISAGGDIDREGLSNEGMYPVIANTFENKGIIGYYQNQYKVKAPAVTVTGRGDVGFATARFKNFTPVIRLLVIKSKLDVYFLEQVINNKTLVNESTGVPQLTSPQLGRFVIEFPTLKEQQKIGKFFKNLDDQIETEEKKLDKLQKMKEAYLEEMFV